MPTPESSVAFQKLVEARNRLSEVSKQLRAVHVGLGTERERALQVEWTEAFHAFQKAVREFSEIVARMDEAIEERRVQGEGII